MPKISPARSDAEKTKPPESFEYLPRAWDNTAVWGLEAVGAHFKALRDPINTSPPQGKFALQVLGAAAELERALIRERTKAGLRAAKARGRVGETHGCARAIPTPSGNWRESATGST